MKARLSSVEPRRITCGAWGPELQSKRMSYANFMAFFLVFRCEVEISWVLSGAFYAVAGPLGRDWEGELVAKEFCVQLVGGGAPIGRKRGRTAPLRKRTFDSTMGFPGEDVAMQLQ